MRHATFVQQAVFWAACFAAMLGAMAGLAWVVS